MSYTKTNWENLPSTNTPINATNLNKIENGIKDNETNIGNLTNLNTTEKSNLVGSINEVLNLINGIFKNNGTQLTSNDNMNNVLTPGVYRQGSISMPSNAPTGANNAYVLVLKRESGADYNIDFIIQIWISVNSNNIYFRTIGESAGSWKALS